MAGVDTEEKKRLNESETRKISPCRIRVSIASLVVIAISPSRTRKMRIRPRFAVSLPHRSSKERLIGAKEENEAG